ncbi:MAG: hypothetical protein HY279_08155 [Nitrospinae bacterium]|nr:hypothetical protein [Nitrospinota bacterium]
MEGKFMFFGEYLIYKEKISQEDLNFALKFQKDENIMNAISAITNGYLKYEDISKIMDYMRMSGLKFNEAAVNLRLLNNEQIEKILSDKEKVQHQIGEILVMCGAIGKIEIEKELRSFLLQFQGETLLQPQMNAA